MKPIVLIQSFPLGKWKFPDKVDPLKELDDKEFASIIEEMLSGKTNHNSEIDFFRIKDESETHLFTSNKEELSLSAVSLRIAMKASGKPLRRTKKSLEAIANEIRDAIHQLEIKKWRNFVSLEELGSFIDGGQLDSIYSHNEDPTKLI